jgi:hypothetical protein
MPTSEAFRNFIFTLIVLFVMGIIGMLLKASYRLPSEVAPIKAIPVAQPVEAPVAEARAYKSGDFWVLPNPKLIDSRGNEADTLRIKSGTKEDVFVLYFVDALEATWDHPKRISEQAAAFNHAPGQKVVDAGKNALAYVKNLLTQKPFKVYTKWGRVPETERFYALVSVEIEPGKTVDLGELLLRKGYALATGQPTPLMPSEMKASGDHAKDLQKALALAKTEHVGLWNAVP